MGNVVIEHKGAKITTTVGSEKYESQFGGITGLENFKYTNGNIPIGYEHRPDLISNVFMNTPVSWWLICERNAIFDVFEQLKPGEALRLPL